MKRVLILTWLMMMSSVCSAADSLLDCDSCNMVARYVLQDGKSVANLGRADICLNCELEKSFCSRKRHYRGKGEEKLGLCYACLFEVDGEARLKEILRTNGMNRDKIEQVVARCSAKKSKFSQKTWQYEGSDVNGILRKPVSEAKRRLLARSQQYRKDGTKYKSIPLTQEPEDTSDSCCFCF